MILVCNKLEALPLWNGGIMVLRWSMGILLVVHLLRALVSLCSLACPAASNLTVMCR